MLLHSDFLLSVLYVLRINFSHFIRKFQIQIFGCFPVLYLIIMEEKSANNKIQLKSTAKGLSSFIGHKSRVRKCNQCQVDLQTYQR